MKTTRFFLFCLAALIGVASCTDPVEPELDSPVLVSTSPKDGATDISGTTLDIVLKFDRNIKKPSADSFTIEPEATVSNIDAHDKGVYISLSGLNSDSPYTLTIPANTLVGYSDGSVYNKEIKITFSMAYTASEDNYPRNVTSALSNPNASAVANSLYSYLLDCYGTRTISGAMGGTAWETSYTDNIATLTGTYPGIVGFDYIFNNWPAKTWSGCPDYNDITPIKNAWEAHNIIQIGWHWCVPPAEGTTDLNKYSYNTKAFDITQALTEGTWQNADMKKQLKQVAGFLTVLKNAGIPVLWRPLHEAAGDYTWGAWFWWGYGGAEPCKQLWKYMYKLFTEEYQLDNLIWVWTAQTSDGGKLAKVADLEKWYPGDEYVDIVGADLYGAKGVSGSSAFQLVNNSVKGKKMVTLSEFGNLLDINKYFEEDSPWLYFMNWCNFENGNPVLFCKNSDGSYSWNNTAEDWKTALSNPHTINRSDIPDISKYVSPDAGWEKANIAVKNMGTGWNLGNTLDAWGNWIPEGSSIEKYETCWGQPQTKPALLKMFKDAGFGAIRVPVTWRQHMDSNGNIDKAWMDRVEQTVNYVLDNGMYCIINVHHDTGEQGWLIADQGVYDDTREKYIKIWQQIATRFRDYGPKLVYESFNEMLDKSNTWNAPKNAESYSVINAYNKDFVETVRATGGNNRYRNLVLNDYCASNFASVLDTMEMPEDLVSGHYIIEFHSYSPYDFAMGGSKTVFDSVAEKEVQEQIAKAAAISAKKGVPMIIGEYGCTSGKAPQSEMAKQAYCYVSTAKKYNIACFYWMNLSDGKDRDVPKWTMPEIKDAVIKAINE